MSSPIRRRRKPVSCTPCRRRKMRCDRNLPACGNCLDRDEMGACTYVSRRIREPQRHEEATPNTDDFQGKIERLEQLIMKLVDNHSNRGMDDISQANDSYGLERRHVDADYPTNSQARVDFPTMASKDGEKFYTPTKEPSLIRIDAHYSKSHSIDGAHWARLLNEIDEVRSYVRTQQRQYENQTQRISLMLNGSPDSAGSALLFGPSKAVDRADILTQLPSKYACDTMVSHYFTRLDPALYVLHPPTFHDQYEKFWKDQNTTSIVWVAQLFAMLRIAVNDWARKEDEPRGYQGKCDDMAVDFRNRFTDCLILANYLQPHEHLVDALILHLYAEYASSRDCKPGVWVLVGFITRLAMKMGYHQDSQPLLQNSPFHAEMRRRAWAFIRQADILFSFQVGLPSMTKISNYEPSLPRNFYDDDSFNEGCKGIPFPLPNTEPTEISYVIAKTRLAFGFAQALQELEPRELVSYERVLEIDRNLREEYANVPLMYKLGDMSEQTEDPLPLIFSRFTMASLHHKSLCVLHSRYLEKARTNEQYLYSRRICLESAMSILRLQAVQHYDFSPEGKLRSLIKYQTSLSIHDYLLAATILSAELYLGKPDDTNTSRSTRSSLSAPSWIDMLTSLDRCANAFSQMRDKSIEAYKASDVLGMLLRKFQASTNPRRFTVYKGLEPYSKGAKAFQSSENELDRQMTGRHTQWSSHDASKSNYGLEWLRPRRNSVTVIEASTQNSRMGAMQLTRDAPLATQSTLDFASRPDRHVLFQESDSHGQVENSIDSHFDYPSQSNFADPENECGNFSNNINPTDDNMSEGTSSWYYSLLDLSDPVSTLWNLNSDNNHKAY